VDPDAVRRVASRVRGIQRVFEKRFPPPRATPIAFRAGTISGRRPDGALASDATSAEDRRARQREMTSVVLPRGSSSTKSVAALELLLSESLEFFDERRSLDVQQFCGAISVSTCAIE
jgi:hypothetical protein